VGVLIVDRRRTGRARRAPSLQGLADVHRLARGIGERVGAGEQHRGFQLGDELLDQRPGRVDAAAAIGAVDR
jgi:hypothetical protein